MKTLILLLFALSSSVKVNAEEPVLYSVQKVFANGNVSQITSRPLQRENCRGLQFQDPELNLNRLHLILTAGEGTISAEGKQIIVCLISSSVTLSSKKSNKLKFNYLITRDSSDVVSKPSSNPVPTLAPKPVPTPAEPVAPVALKNNKSFKAFTGLSYHSHINTDNLTHTTQTFSGPQARLMMSGLLPVSRFGLSSIHLLLGGDILNPSLSQQFFASAAAQVQIFKSGSLPAFLGLGINFITFLGQYPYGIISNVAPRTELSLGKVNEKHLEFSYVPFIGTKLDLTSATAKLLGTFPIHLFHHPFTFGLEGEIISVSTSSYGDLATFRSYGVSSMLGFNLGEPK